MRESFFRCDSCKNQIDGEGFMVVGNLFSIHRAENSVGWVPDGLVIGDSFPDVAPFRRSDIKEHHYCKKCFLELVNAEI